MDRPTLDRFCRLLEAATVADNHAEPVARRRRRPDKPASTFDPFLALSSFANVVEALVFYDRVLVLYGDVERRMRDLLGTDSPVAQVPSDFSTGEQGYFLDPLMMIAALGDLDDATKDGSPLIERLKAHWTRLLPSLKWPSHSLDGYSEMFPARTNLAVFDQMINPAWDIFALRDVDHQWVGPEQGQLQKLVLANDARTLFYSRVAANLRFALAEDGNARVRYVGGPLRTPMIRALAELAEAALEPEEAVRAEDLLSEAWASARPGEGMAVPMPVWFEAVLSRARTRSDVPAVIAEYRKAAEPFRRRRDKIEEALARRDGQALAPLLATLQGDTAALTSRVTTGASVALDVVDTGITTLTPLPVGPSLALRLLSAPIGRQRLQRLKLRVFHPELRIVYDLGQHASRLGNALPVAFDLFELDKAYAEEPLRFLRRLGSVSSVT